MRTWGFLNLNLLKQNLHIHSLCLITSPVTSKQQYVATVTKSFRAEKQLPVKRYFFFKLYSIISKFSTPVQEWVKIQSEKLFNHKWKFNFSADF